MERDIEKWNKLNKDEVVSELVKRDDELLRRDRALAKRDRQVDKLLQQQQKTLMLLSNLVRANTGHRKQLPLKNIKLENNVKQEIVNLIDSDEDENVNESAGNTVEIDANEAPVSLSPAANLQINLNSDQQNTPMDISNNSVRLPDTCVSSSYTGPNEVQPDMAPVPNNNIGNANPFSNGTLNDVQGNKVPTSDGFNEASISSLTAFAMKHNLPLISNPGLISASKPIKPELPKPSSDVQAKSTSQPNIIKSTGKEGDKKDMIKCLDCGQDFLSMYHIYQHASIVHYYSQCNEIAKTLISVEGKCSKCDVVLGNTSSHYWHIGVKHKMVLSLMTEEKQKVYMKLEMLKGFKQSSTDNTLPLGGLHNPGLQAAPIIPTPSASYDDIAEPEPISNSQSSNERTINQDGFDDYFPFQPHMLDPASNSPKNDMLEQQKPDKKSFQCPDCSMQFNVVSMLFNHSASGHYRDQMVILAKSIISPNGECLECHSILQSKASYPAHVGAKHRKILTVMSDEKRSEYMVFEKSAGSNRSSSSANMDTNNMAQNSSISTANQSDSSSPQRHNTASPNVTTSVTPKGTSNGWKCPDCDKFFQTPSSIFVHAVTTHYRKQCRESCRTIFDNGKCKICGIVVKDATQSLILHYGSTHRKILSHMTEETKNFYAQFENDGGRRNASRALNSSNSIQLPLTDDYPDSEVTNSKSTNNISNPWRPFNSHKDDSSESEDDEIVKKSGSPSSESTPSGLDMIEQQLEKEINNSSKTSDATSDPEGDRYLGSQTKEASKLSCPNRKCKELFSSTVMLREHRKAAHSFSCPQCHNPFLTKQSMQLHMKNSCKNR